jgi:uncharacterized protein (DUF1330 family)
MGITFESDSEVHRKYGGRALVRGGTCEAMEGRARSRHVVREFPDYATALACYRSPEYQRAKPLRLPHSVIDFVIIEGYEGMQPDRPATPSAAGARKGYWIAHVDVTEPEGYQAYMVADMVPIGNYGGRFLVRGGTREVVEGSVRARTVVLEFPSYQAALACYRSPDYQAAAALRKGKAEFDLIIVEGCDSAQP